MVNFCLVEDKHCKRRKLLMGSGGQSFFVKDCQCADRTKCRVERRRQDAPDR
jgi:hypothetical protein